jgi:hypothetical protein
MAVKYELYKMEMSLDIVPKHENKRNYGRNSVRNFFLNCFDQFRFWAQPFRAYRGGYLKLAAFGGRGRRLAPHRGDFYKEMKCSDR